MKRVARFFCLVAVVVIMVQCEPQPDDLKLFDEYVVSTNYNKTVDFNSYATYSIKSDTIGLISNNINDDTIIVGTNYARPVVQQVRSNLDSRGFTEVAPDENPDLAINIYIVKNLNIYQQYNPGYYYPSYSGYYNYYYGYPGVTTYVSNTGILVVELVDLKNIVGGQVKIIWNAQMGDVFSSIDLNKQSMDAIDQAFAQSPFILTE
jgi:hypothetical protein